MNYNLVNFCEIDKFASKSYCEIHNVNPDLNLGDIQTVNRGGQKRIDLITYSFPCTDLSIAGYQKGFYDEDGNKTRSGLFFDALRVIKLNKPKFAIAENVKPLAGKKFKNEFKIVLDSLEEIGYNNYWKILNSKDFGIPQNRERVFIISIRKDIDNGKFEFPKPITKCPDVIDILEDSVDDKYYLNNDKAKQLVSIINSKYNINDRIVVDGSINDPKLKTVSNCIVSRYDCGISNQKSMGCMVIERDKTVCEIRTDEGIRFFNNDLCGALRTTNACGDKYVIEADNIINKSNRQKNIIGNYKIRKLTPKECFRLMGFDDEDFEKALKVNSNSQLYKQAGNSVVVNVLKEIFEQIKIAFPNDFNNNINLISLFSGIGAYEKALDKI